MKSWEVTELTALGIAFIGSGSTKLNVHANDTAGLPAKQLYKKLLISGSVTELGETRTLISPTGGAAVVRVQIYTTLKSVHQGLPCGHVTSIFVAVYIMVELLSKTAMLKCAIIGRNGIQIVAHFGFITWLEIAFL